MQLQLTVQDMHRVWSSLLVDVKQRHLPHWIVVWKYPHMLAKVIVFGHVEHLHDITHNHQLRLQ